MQRLLDGRRAKRHDERWNLGQAGEGPFVVSVYLFSFSVGHGKPPNVGGDIFDSIFCINGGTTLMPGVVAIEAGLCGGIKINL